MHVCEDFANISATATVQKIITEILPPSSGQTFSKDARDLLMECCVEFITLISSEANDISEKEAKKTIACEHVEKALRDLGFADYIPDVLAVAEEHKQQLKVCRIAWNCGPLRRMLTLISTIVTREEAEQDGTKWSHRRGAATATARAVPIGD
jgi:histone H3/H4